MRHRFVNSPAARRPHFLTWRVKLTLARYWAGYLTGERSSSRLDAEFYNCDLAEWPAFVCWHLRNIVIECNTICRLWGEIPLEHWIAAEESLAVVRQAERLYTGIPEIRRITRDEDYNCYRDNQGS